MRKQTVAVVIHQLASTVGVIVLSGASCYQFVELLRMVRLSATRGWAVALLFVPGFPFQAAAGLAFGFGLARYLQTRYVFFVWVLPFLFFCFGALIVAPNPPQVSYLVGAGCRVVDGCFYQVLFTLPLITSAFYTLGALVAVVCSQKVRRRDRSRAGDETNG